MKIKITLLLSGLLLFSSWIAKADEGMWLPLLLKEVNYDEMKAKGLNLTAEQIYSINNASLKDAIVSLNSGACTAELVSENGLMMTCFHCVHKYIQQHSSIEKDYLAEGFWAENRKKELRNDKLKASFLIRMEDVTAKVKSELYEGMSDAEREEKVEEISEGIIKTATKGTHYEAKVKNYFDGNQYYLLVYETFEDVRLVGSPPAQIGRFGGDSDNWEWPRYRADFAFLRVYTAPSGKPARYKRTNIPYKSKHYLPFSAKGVKKGDFSMILGYPGGTKRFMTSYGVKSAMEYKNPVTIKLRTKKLELIRNAMQENEEINIQYNAKYYKSSNYWKYYQGQVEMVEKLGIVAKKKAKEDRFLKWVQSDPERGKKYGHVIPDIERAYSELNKYIPAVFYANEAVFRGGELLYYAYSYNSLYNELEMATDQENINIKAKKLMYEAKKYFKNYNIELDKKITTELVKLYYNDVAKEYHPVGFAEIEKKYKGSVDAFIESIYKKTLFSSKDKVLNFLTEPDFKKLDRDPALTLIMDIFRKYREVKKLYRNAIVEIEGPQRKFVAGLMEMDKGKKFYPDANRTMRMTYGQVTDYSPSKDKYHDYNTTMAQMFEKENKNPTNPDYNSPDKLKQLYKTKDFGGYDDNGVMTTCFVSNNDITGGFSGAPALDGDGNIIGITFDLNWEATSVDITFDPDLQRSVITDSRYILYLVEKYAGSTHIMDELKVIR